MKYQYEIFDILRKYNMKLNPKKSAFGFSLGKFLNLLGSNSGIKANLDKIMVIEEILEVLKDIKAVQRLAMRLAA